MQVTQDKGYKGKGMEGRIAFWYAKNTRKDMAEFRALAERFARDMPAGSRILEVAPGPGYLAIELAKRGPYMITGLDISETFVDIATENAWNESVKVDFRHGNASDMPFPDGCFDFVICRAAFKNFSQPIRAFDEMHRVLKPGGRALIIDLRKDASMADINAYIRGAGLGWMNSLVYKATFRFMLLPRAYSKRQFMEMASGSRFGACEIAADNIGFEVSLRK